MEFTAKNIQQLIGIPKIRYEYLKSKANIQPGYEEAEGTGRSHKYTFKNVMQFALAHRASRFGLAHVIGALARTRRAASERHGTLPCGWAAVRRRLQARGPATARMAIAAWRLIRRR